MVGGKPNKIYKHPKTIMRNLVTIDSAVSDKKLLNPFQANSTLKNRASFFFLEPHDPDTVKCN